MSEKNKAETKVDTNQSNKSTLVSKETLDKIKNINIAEKIPFLGTMFSKRLCAAFVDTIFAFLPIIVATFLSVFFPAPLNSFVTLLGSIAAAALMALRDAPLIPVFDYKSPGKFFLGLNIIDTNRNRITNFASIKRNLCFVSLYTISGISLLLQSINAWLALLFSLLHILPMVWIGFEAYKLYKSPNNQRPGDKLAGTVVELY